MKHAGQIILRILFGQLIAIPFAFVVLIALLPVLRSAEKSTDVEMIGHSGPADWVIFFVWAVISLIITATLLVNRKPKGKEKDE